MNKKLSLFLACCIAGGFAAACNETTEWSYDGIGCTTDGEQLCDGNIVKVCQDGSYVVEKTCGAGEICVQDKALHTAVCQSGSPACTASCVDGVLTLCNADGTAAAPVECADSNKVCGTDASGAPVCVESTPVVGDECDTLDAVRCNAENTAVEKCTADGERKVWVATPCTEGVCVVEDSVAQCKADDGKCAEGATKCDGDKLVTCGSDGVYGETDGCTENQVCRTNTEDNTAACEELTCDADGATYQVGEGVCSDDKTKLSTCVVEMDENGVKTASMKEGSCTGGTMDICEPATDDSPATCRSFKDCDGYITGGIKCDEGNVKICDDGEWKVKEECKDGKVCSATDATCVTPATGDCTVNGAVVSNGKTVCDGASIVTCTDGKTSTTACTTEVANAAATCGMAGDPAVATCGFKCETGYALSEDGTSCVESQKYTTIKAIRADFDKFSDFNGAKTCEDSKTRNTSIDADIEITGVVSAVRNGKGFYLQDDEAGMQVYCTTCSKYADDTEMKIGDKVTVIANKMGQFYCDLQVTGDVSVTKISSGNEIEYQYIDIKEINTPNPNGSYSQMLVGVANVTATKHDTDPKGYTLTDSTGEIVANEYFISTSLSLNADKSYYVKGVLLYAYKNNVIAPRGADDIIEMCEENSTKCDPATNTYQQCKWGEWQEANDCSDFRFVEGSHVNAKTYACDADHVACVIATCEDGYQPNAVGNACEKKDVENKCGNDKDGNAVALDSYFCVSDTEYALCDQSTGLRGTVQSCASTYQCVSSSVNVLRGCACTAETSSVCTSESGMASVTSCDVATGEMKTVDCPKNSYSRAVCTADNQCDIECKISGHVKNTGNTGCVKCNAENATACPAGQVCGEDGKCVTKTPITECTKDEDCPSPENVLSSCEENKCVYICNDGYRLDGKTCLTCDNSEGVADWKKGGECVIEKCDDTKGYALTPVDNKCKRTECTEGTLECLSESTFRVCELGVWEDYNAPIGAQCVDGKVSCKAEYFCNGNVVTGCEEKTGAPFVVVTELEDCSANTNGAIECSSETGECVVPKDLQCGTLNAGKCEGSTAYICTQASESDPLYWKKVADCSASQTCAVLEGTGAFCMSMPAVCEAGTKRCSSDNKAVQTCKADGSAWEDTTTCTETQECKADGGTATCVDKTPVVEKKTLIISEYVHGSSNKRAIELYNATDADVDLSKCVLNYYMNGSTIKDGASKALSGTVKAGEVYVTCSSAMADDVKCNDKSLTATFNGDDAIELVCEKNILDVMGKVGDSTSWGKSKTLVRNCNITHGNTTYDSNEWTSFAKDTYTNLGAHQVVDCKL